MAGKGHEPYQEVRGVKHPYSDRLAAETCLQALRAGGSL
jgi:UDP-N-acetylmuramoyl-L-alanyl-D-glutamate--2,6-diaminopimelate ligase